MSLSRFHNRWLNFGFRAAEVGVAARSAIALRMLHFASGGTRAYNEMARMSVEKMTASQKQRSRGQVPRWLVTIKPQPRTVL